MDYEESASLTLLKKIYWKRGCSFCSLFFSESYYGNEVLYDRFIYLKLHYFSEGKDVNE